MIVFKYMVFEMGKINSSNSIELYHKKYFLEAVDGFREYSEFNGEFSTLFERYRRNIDLLHLTPEHKYLEVGCGRGEVCIYHALQGGSATGIDYSVDAIDLAVKKAESLAVSVDFMASSFSEVRLESDFYDRVLASEFIEHISADEGLEFVRIAYEALRPGGRLLIFTHPNTMQRKIGYPLIRILKLFQGVVLPKKQADTLDDHYRLYHLNEQNYFSLKKLMGSVDFKIIDIGYDVGFDGENGFLKSLAVKVIKKTFFRHVFLTNLYVIAEK